MSDASNAESPAPAISGAASGLRRNLVAGSKLALGRPVARTDFAISTGHALLALALGWCAIVIEARVAAGAGSKFWIWGFMYEAAQMHLWLASVALLAWVLRRSGGIPLLIVALSFASLPVWLLCRALEHVATLYAPHADDVYVRLFHWSSLAWYGLIGWRVLGLPPGLERWRRAPAALAYLGALFAITELLPASPLFYQNIEAPPALDIEAVYYRQADLVEAQLQQLTPQRPAQVDLYFIGLGAYADQDVFMREVQQVDRIVVDRLRLAGRTLSLINNPQTVHTTPLATRYNLEHMLQGLARIIDREQDIVMLFVTSHGNDDASVAVEFGALGLNDIYADDLRDMLDEAGIRWRVVMISACYSGSFIELLRSPDTLVMTAAAPDRSSFGCSNENDWTYFGRAYFAEALLRTTDLIEAFKLAQIGIAERERREGKAASQPQLAAGDNIVQHLRAWQPAPAPRPAAQPSDSR